jgi:hypothetical protein
MVRAKIYLRVSGGEGGVGRGFFLNTVEKLNLVNLSFSIIKERPAWLFHRR